MTKTHDDFARHVLLSVISLALLASTVAVAATAQTIPTLSKKEVKTLLVTAKTPADQERLAAYYRDKAKDLRAKAQKFAARAESMQGLPAVNESKQGLPANARSTTAISRSYTDRKPRMRMLWRRNTSNSPNPQWYNSSSRGWQYTTLPDSQGESPSDRLTATKSPVRL
jgi:hypothetical protein